VTGGTVDGSNVVLGHRLAAAELGVGPLLADTAVDTARRRHVHSRHVGAIQPRAVVKILRTDGAAARKLHSKRSCRMSEFPRPHKPVGRK